MNMLLRNTNNKTILWHTNQNRNVTKNSLLFFEITSTLLLELPIKMVTCITN